MFSVETTISPMRYDTLLDRVLELIAMDVTGESRKESPIDTGRLRGSISLPIRLDAYTWGIAINAAYWKPVHFGAWPHDIFPRNKKALAFTVKGANVICSVVHHPGNKPNPFVDRAFKTVETHLDTIVDYALEEAGL